MDAFSCHESSQGYLRSRLPRVAMLLSKGNAAAGAILTLMACLSTHGHRHPVKAASEGRVWVPGTVRVCFDLFGPYSHRGPQEPCQLKSKGQAELTPPFGDLGKSGTTSPSSLHQECQGPALAGLACFWVGVSRLEMSDRQNRYTKEIQRHRIEPGGKSGKD